VGAYNERLANIAGVNNERSADLAEYGLWNTTIGFEADT
jgi:hypothetical protein